MPQEETDDSHMLKKKKESGRKSFFKATWIMTMVFIITFLFSSSNIYSWAKGLKDARARDFFLSFVEPLHFLFARFELDTIHKRVRNIFLTLSSQEAEEGSALSVNNPMEIPEPEENPVAHNAGNGPSQAIPLPVLSPLAGNEDKLVLQVYSTHSPLKLLIVGDSLGDSIYGALSSYVSSDPAMSLYARCQVSSTLSNPHFYDWPKNIKEILSAATYDLAIVTLGANDAQTIWEGDKGYVYGSPGWKEAYKRRINGFLDNFLKRGMAVYWLAVPPMRKAGYRERMEKINEITRKICGGKKAVFFFSTAAVLGNGEGKYTQFLLVDGAQIRVRTNDGIHYTRKGARLLVEQLMASIKKEYIFQKDLNSRPADNLSLLFR